MVQLLEGRQCKQVPIGIKDQWDGNPRDFAPRTSIDAPRSTKVQNLAFVIERNTLDCMQAQIRFDALGPI